MENSKIYKIKKGKNLKNGKRRVLKLEQGRSRKIGKGKNSEIEKGKSGKKGYQLKKDQHPHYGRTYIKKICSNYFFCKLICNTPVMF